MMQPFNRARDIAAHLATLLGAINPANGFETEMGERVFRGRRKIDEEHIPCCVLIEGEDHVGGTQGPSSQQITQAYAIAGYAPCDPDHPNDTAHQIISDVKRALFRLTDTSTRAEQATGTRNLGGRVKSLVYKGRDIGMRADGSPIVFAVVQIEISYVENLEAG